MQHAHGRRSIRAAAAVICGLLAAAAALPAGAVESPTAAIRSDAHRLANDVERESHVVGHQVSGQTQRLHRQLVTAREQASAQLHRFGRRVQRWWHGVRSS
jgi:hypothetical protein